MPVTRAHKSFMEPVGRKRRPQALAREPQDLRYEHLRMLRETCDSMMQEETYLGNSQSFNTWNVELATIHQSICRLEELAGARPRQEEAEPPRLWPKPAAHDLEEWKCLARNADVLLHVRLCYRREEDSAHEISYGRMFISTAGLCWVPALGEELEEGPSIIDWQEIVGLKLAKGDDNILAVEDDQIQVSLATGDVLHLLLAMPRFGPEDLTRLLEIWQAYRNGPIVEDKADIPRLFRHQPSFLRASSADSATPSFVSATLPDRLPLEAVPPNSKELGTFSLPGASLQDIHAALKAEDGGPLRHALCDETVMGAFDVALSPWIKAKSSKTLVRRLRFRIRLPTGAAVLGATSSAVTDIFRLCPARDSMIVLVSASCTHDVPFVGNKFRIEAHYVFKQDDAEGVRFQLFMRVVWLEDLSFFSPVSKETVEDETEVKMRNVAQALARSLGQGSLARTPKEISDDPVS